MKILQASCQAELVVQRSRFLAVLEPLGDAQEARVLLKGLKETHAGAAHVVHAFQVGLDRSLTGGCSDDGEPPGTAGRPVYDVLKGFGCSQVFLGVVRYFGGIKLGTGGLVKAYGDAAKLVLAGALWEEYRPVQVFDLVLTYPEHRPVTDLVFESEGKVLQEGFGEVVACRLSIPVQNVDSFRLRLSDLTKGRLQLPGPS